MSKKVKQLAKGLARRASVFGRKEDLVFQGTSSSSSRRRALLEHVPELSVASFILWILDYVSFFRNIISCQMEILIPSMHTPCSIGTRQMLLRI
jgi:hypothetical protein